MKSIILTGGGTAGHCTPNLALFKDLEKHFDKVYYIGSKNGIERNIVEQARIEYFPIECVKLERKITAKNLFLPFKLVKGITEAKKILKKLKPCVVFSKGGYVSLPVVLASKALKIPVVIHESDLSVGLANKIAIKSATEVLTAFETTAQNIPNAKCVGTPLRKQLFLPHDKNALRKKYGLTDIKPVLLVTGGSQGSEAINSLCVNNLDFLCKRYQVLHLTGKGKMRNIKQKGYIQFEFSSDMDELLSIADYAVTRAGANTLFELVALKIPTLAIPLPKGNSRGDQIENAEYFYKKGLIDVLYEENANDISFQNALKKLENDGDEFVRNANELSLSGATDKIVKILAKYANDRTSFNSAKIAYNFIDGNSRI